MKIAALLALLFINCLAYAQQATEQATQKVYDTVDKMPKLGYDLMDYLNNNVRYPNEAREEAIQGSVVVKFVVNEDGSISEARITKHLCASCDAEVLRVINGMPKWIPGKNNGVPVKCYFSQAITFNLGKRTSWKKRKKKNE